MVDFTNQFINSQEFGSLFVKVNSLDGVLDAPSNPITRSGRYNPSSKLSGYDSTFRDLGLSFDAHPLTGQPKVVKDADSIKQSIKNLILTDAGERPFQPNLGGNIRTKLFENITPTTKREIEEDIERTILNYEPRVILLDTTVTTQGNSVVVRIEFKIRTIERVEAFTMFLERV